MAYMCPRCGKPVQRGYGDKGKGFLVFLWSHAFGPLECAKCGKIPRSEFPEEIQTKMKIGSYVLFAVSIVVFGTCLLFAVMK